MTNVRTSNQVLPTFHIKLVHKRFSLNNRLAKKATCPASRDAWKIFFWVVHVAARPFSKMLKAVGIYINTNKSRI
uniref:Uncharacterized protein n=1 Tax=Manihot esculenta TaxID=3983 RepID=A0A2C9VKK7_MANES